MVSSTFHPFPRLPLELRQQIWEEACLPLGPFQRGVQYLDITVDGLVAPPCNLLETSEHGSSNISAYMIDGGLWMACKESREIIIKHTHFEEWIQLQNQAIDEGHRLMSYEADWDSDESDGHPATIAIKEGNQEWHVLLYPAKDIVCIRPHVEIPMHQEYGETCIDISFVQDPENELCQSMPVDNIAFEFDQSWMEGCGLEMSYYDMKNEQSARGCWASLIREAIQRAAPRRSLWIVDKNAKWFNRSVTSERIVYRDCEGEYVEGSWDDVPESTGDGVSFSASAFLGSFFCANSMELREVFAGPGSYYPCAYESDEEAHEFELKDRIRLLVRRENQVQETTWRCREKCERIGWCICQDDEGNWWDDED
ncbi:hypothetical protein NXS19_002968 [Fusarium pseudograminearum]|uniref:2EXR domain-containing protein n=1 Tax=Fusarium pseudograminearum (strain CS3096) TaxID=1028729 RepID=K3VMM7_FUSPC|nr:hypothetical protein FPSE_03746 [Fusarium pseudograminearum CS3096]EKJ75974.1 hypothetical protein FPSE_03746 [Fusarium pseudograminearum CS3096]UZP35152.1 hypothetical protein NXS19_002968 [Fusarium pseudograminearum]